MREQSTAMAVLCRAGSLLCALPVQTVEETMRLLPLEPLPDLPPFVLGLSVVRGQPIPVVHAGRLLGTGDAVPTRLVTLKLSERRVALAVESVVGVRDLSALEFDALPPLVGASEPLVAAIGVLDRQLLVVLRSARVVPEAVLALGTPA